MIITIGRKFSLLIKTFKLKFILCLMVFFLMSMVLYGYEDFIKVEELVLSDFGQVSLKGAYDKQFEEVYIEFKKNFTERGEAGASVSITQKGKTVVDLWGGLADIETANPWEKDTLALIWSSTKGITSFALNMLISRGLVDLDAPVTDYWPEYGSNGKENTTIRMILTHQTGVQHFKEIIKPGGFADWEYMVDLIESQSPFFKPGTAQGYQILTHGWLVGEIVRRVTGKSLKVFVQEEIAAPLNADFSIGLDSADYNRAAKIIFFDVPNIPLSDFWLKLLGEPGSLQNQIFFNTGGFVSAFDSALYRSAEIGAANGYTNGRGLAKMYLPLANGGQFKGVSFVDKKLLDQMGTVFSAGYDLTFLVPLRFGLGFMKTMANSSDPNPNNRESLAMSENAFGHLGIGGSLGFADPYENISFGYVMNRMGPGTLMNATGQTLVDALYRSMDYELDLSGRWVKSFNENSDDDDDDDDDDDNEN